MSFFHTTSAAAARSRRTKEREGHPRASSTNNAGRRHGTSSRSQDNRSPPSNAPAPQGSLYAQQNLTLDQMSGVSANATESTSSAPISPTSSIHQSITQRSGVIHLSQLPYTPIALQQYLDEDQGDDDQETEDNETRASKETEKTASTSVTIPVPSSNAEYLVAEKYYSLPAPNEDEKAELNIARPRMIRDTARPVSDIGFSDSWRAYDKSSFNTVRNSTAYAGITSAAPQPNQDGGQHAGEAVDNTTRIESEKSAGQESRSNTKYTSEAPSLASRTSSQSEVVPYMTNSTEMKPSGHESIEHPTNMIRVTSHQSAPFMSRTFTPPAPPTGSSRARAQTPPVFVSPIPMRSRIGGDNFVASYATPTHPPSNQLLQNSTMSETYQGYPVFQDFTELSSMPYGLPPPMYNNVTGIPQAAIRPDMQRMQSQLQEDQSEHPFILISRMLSVLPELQRFIVHCQQSGLDSSFDLSNSQHSNQQNETQILSQQLEEKAQAIEQQHKDEILALNQRITELQVKLSYVEGDLAKRKQSRDDLHAELITRRVESASALKLASDEKDRLQKQHNDRHTVLEKEIKDHLQSVRYEIDRGKDYNNELRGQVGELRAAYLAKEAEITCSFERQRTELTAIHEHVVQNLTTQLENEAIKSKNLTTQLTEMEQRQSNERSHLEEQFELHKTSMTRSFDERTAALEEEIKAERTRASRSLEDSTKLAKELNDMRSLAATDRAKLQAMAKSLRDTASKFEMESAS